MNIFATSLDPVEAAAALDDKRVNKMVSETAQMLSTALRRHHKVSDTDIAWVVLYKSAYEKHPCTLWAGDTRSNFAWLCRHGLALCEVYQDVFGREHKSKIVIRLAQSWIKKIPSGDFTEFADCTEFQHRSDLPIIKRYQMFMNLKWKVRDEEQPTWRKRNPPTWKK